MLRVDPSSPTPDPRVGSCLLHRTRGRNEDVAVSGPAAYAGHWHHLNRMSRPLRATTIQNLYVAWRQGHFGPAWHPLLEGQQWPYTQSARADFISVALGGLKPHELALRLLGTSKNLLSNVVAPSQERFLCDLFGCNVTIDGLAATLAAPDLSAPAVAAIIKQVWAPNGFRVVLRRGDVEISDLSKFWPCAAYAVARMIDEQVFRLRTHCVAVQAPHAAVCAALLAGDTGVRASALSTHDAVRLAAFLKIGPWNNPQRRAETLQVLRSSTAHPMTNTCAQRNDPRFWASGRLACRGWDQCGHCADDTTSTPASTIESLYNAVIGVDGVSHPDAVLSACSRPCLVATGDPNQFKNYGRMDFGRILQAVTRAGIQAP